MTFRHALRCFWPKPFHTQGLGLYRCPGLLNLSTLLAHDVKLRIIFATICYFLSVFTYRRCTMRITQTVEK